MRSILYDCVEGRTLVYSCEFRMKLQKGHWVWILDKGRVMTRDQHGKALTMFGCQSDITEFMETKIALQESRERYYRITDNARDMIYRMSIPERRYEYVNASALQIFGHPPEVFLNQPLLIRELFPPAWSGFFEEKWADLLRGQVDPFYEYQIFHGKTQEIRWLHQRNVLIRDEHGKLVAIEGIVTDVTDRKQAEEALRASEQRVLLATSAAGIGIWEWDILADTMFWDERICRLYGIEALPGEYGLEYWQNCLHPDDREKTVQAALSAVQGEKEYDVEFRVQWPDGTFRWMKGNGLVIRDEEGTPVKTFGTNYDLTERKEMEAQLLQSQKMEAVGRLAGGVAHDFNNMLSVIILHSDIMLQELQEQNRLRNSLEEIRKATNRSADLTRQLLAFARKQSVTPKVIDLNQTVEGMLKMLKRLSGENINISWNPVEDSWPVRIDPSQIDQILANLCVNARDAIQNVGEVNIMTGNTHFEEKELVDHPEVEPGDYTLLSVSDNGCGMTAEELPLVFKPFYTTKEQGKGTGLGLATVYGVVQQNKGFIDVISVPKQGTCFKIYLPKHKTTEDIREEQKETHAVQKGSETILVVEDEQAILELTVAFLQQQGYKVIAASTPGEALRLAREHHGGLHLVITDVVMPEMNGRELAKRLLSYHPSLKCMFMSGYTGDVISDHGLLDEGVFFLHKPFSGFHLFSKVREVLDSEGVEG